MKESFRDLINEAPDTLYKENLNNDLGSKITHKGKETKFTLVGKDSGALIFIDANSITSVNEKGKENVIYISTKDLKKYI